MPLSKSDFAKLMQSMPGASEDEVLAAAKQQDRSMLGKVWDKANEPLTTLPSQAGEAVANTIDRGANSPEIDEAELSGLDMVPGGKLIRNAVGGSRLKGLLAGTAQAAGDVATSLTSPLNLVLTALGLGGEAAGAKGMLGISKGARAVEAALQAPMVAEGGYHAYQGAKEGNFGKVGAGALEAGMGAAGVGSAFKHSTPLPRATGELAVSGTRHASVPVPETPAGVHPAGGLQSGIPESVGRISPASVDSPSAGGRLSRTSEGSGAGASPTSVAANFTELNPQDFLAAVKENRAADTLTQDAPQRFFQSPEGRKWFYGLNKMEEHPVTGKPEIDLTAVMNNDATPGALNSIMPDAIRKGVTTLDAWDIKSAKHPNGFLPSKYAKHGFEEYARVPYDSSYGAPGESLKAGWRTQGWQEGDPLPDVVYMRRQKDQAHLPAEFTAVGEEPVYQRPTFKEPAKSFEKVGSQGGRNLDRVSREQAARGTTPGSGLSAADIKRLKAEGMSVKDINELRRAAK